MDVTSNGASSIRGVEKRSGRDGPGVDGATEEGGPSSVYAHISVPYDKILERCCREVGEAMVRFKGVRAVVEIWVNAGLGYMTGEGARAMFV